MSSVRASGTALQSNERLRFGDFEYNPERRELRKHGIRVRLQPQPLAILVALLEAPGTLVSREDLHSRLWDSDTFVEFDLGLNSTIKRLRSALCDSADSSRYIETVPGQGYRFIAPVERVEVRPTPEQPVVRGRFMGVPWLWAGGFALLTAIALTFVGFGHFSPRTSPKLNFQARDWVLITDFENRTSEPLLDGTLEYGVARELSNSQFVNVVPRERVDDILRLMRKPLDTKIDAALGREICLRDGGIRLLLTGRVERLGSTYVLTANLVDPVRAVTITSLSEEDPAESLMATAVRRLSDQVRETLGEKHELVQQSDQRLEHVTTPSFRAVQLYTQADEMMRSPVVEKQAVAAELLKQALADDPNFASAHLLLAYTYDNRGKVAEAKPEFQRAFDLADTTSDRERLFIQATYYGAVRKDFPKNAEILEALLRLYPDHYWAANNLSYIYSDEDRWDDAWPLFAHLADLRPDDLRFNEGAACGMYSTKNLDAAMPYIQRVRALIAGAGDPKEPVADGPVEMLPIIDSWSKGDVTNARSQFMQLRNSSGLVSTSRDFEGALDYPAFLWSIGQLAEADRQMKAHPDNRNSEILLGMSAYIKGDSLSAKKHFQSFKGEIPGEAPMILMIRSGLGDRVEAAIWKHSTSHSKEVVLGELAMARGQDARAIALLQNGLEDMHKFPTAAFYLGSETLARRYEKQGDLTAALYVLERASEAKGKDSPCMGSMSGAWWLRDELQLADLNRKMGRASEAENVEDELRKMLVHADSDDPIVLALQKRPHEPAVVASK